MADLGDTLPFRADLYDGDGGALVAAQTTVLTVTLPDGTTATPVVPVPAVTGKYAVDYPTTISSPSGRYVGQWLFTLPGGATTSYVETFDVGPSLVTVDEALAHLRAEGVISSDPDLDQLQWLCFAATDAVERDLGRVMVPRTVTETHNGGGPVLLRQSPVLSITSVTDRGVALAGTEYLSDIPAGILWRGGGYTPYPFPAGFQSVTVVYRAGFLDPPRVVRKVALNLIQGSWQVSQQAPHPELTEFSEVDVFAAQAPLSRIEQSGYESLRAAGFA